MWLTLSATDSAVHLSIERVATHGSDENNDFHGIHDDEGKTSSELALQQF